MRLTITLIAGLVILALFNYSIWQKEKVLTHGVTLYLELAPIDPRSLIQGDYMRLAFALERKIDKQLAKDAPKHGRLIIKQNEQNIGEFVSLFKNQSLEANERTIRYRKRSSWRTELSIQPRSFFFQEGHRKIYEAAKYGVFKFLGPNDYLLTALADENFNIIQPSSSN